MRTQYHLYGTDGRRDAWEVVRLIELSRDLPVHQRALDSFDELDSTYWFDEVQRPTVRAVIEHAGLIADADTQYPVITSADGRVMDGMHRVCRALLDGATHIDVVQFVTDPEPTYRSVRVDALPCVYPADLADAPAIARIERACQAQFGAAGRTDISSLPTDTIEEIETRIESGGVMVARQNLEPERYGSIRTVVGWMHTTGACTNISAGMWCPRPSGPIRCEATPTNRQTPA